MANLKKGDKGTEVRNLQIALQSKDFDIGVADGVFRTKTEGAVKGLDKIEWVLAFVKSFVLELGQNWDKYVQLISDFIDHIKTVYNTTRHLIK